MLLETFYEDRTKTLRTGEHIYYALQPMVKMFCYYILAHLVVIKYNKINTQFFHGQKHVTNKIGYEYHS